MKRRTFVAGSAALLTIPGIVHAQTTKPTKRLAMISPAGPVSVMTPNGYPYYKVFFDELARLGIQTARDTRLIGPAPPLIGTGIINRRAGLRSRAYDVFVHISAVERAGLSHLNEGQKVSFEVKTDPKRGKSSAENLRV